MTMDRRHKELRVKEMEANVKKRANEKKAGKTVNIKAFLILLFVLFVWAMMLKSCGA